MMQLLGRLTVTWKQNAMVRSPKPGLHLTVPIFTGHSDVESVADFLLELDTYPIASGCTEAHLLTAVMPVAL